MPTDQTLPAGLRLVATKKEPIKVRITKADPNVAFTCFIARMSAEQITKLGERATLPPGVRPGSPAAKKHQQEYQEYYCKKVIVGWEGLTIDNLRDIWRGDQEIEADKSVTEIPYTPEFASFLMTNTLGSRFGALISNALINGADEDEEEREEKKDA
jgi:hypothetical protein